MEVRDALASYLVQLDADGRSQHTIRQARRHVGMLVRWLGDARDIGAITPADLARFLVSREVKQRADGQDRQPTSANALRSSIRAFFRYAHDAGLVPANPSRLIRRARCGDPPPRAVPEEDAERLRVALDGAKTDAERRDRVFFAVLAATGIRVGSAIGLNVEDLDFEGGTLRLRRMKGGVHGTAISPATTMTMLRDYLGSRTSGPVFLAATGRRVGIRTMGVRLHAWIERAGIGRRFGAHAFRHRVGARIYAATSDLLLTARVLGHRSITSTAVYARADEGRARAAVGA